LENGAMKRRLRVDVLNDRINRRTEKLKVALREGPKAYSTESVWRAVCTSHENAIQRMVWARERVPEGALQ
jgi:hypothetical protein